MPRPGNPHGSPGLRIEGSAVAATQTRPRTNEEPPIRIDEIDEAIRWSSLTLKRGDTYTQWVDHLLDQRLRLMRTHASR
jgi:hypothetical protein